MPFTNVICQIELSSMGPLLYTLQESELKESVCSKLSSWARQVGAELCFYSLAISWAPTNVSGTHVCKRSSELSSMQSL